MKKTLALILVVAMSLTMVTGITAFAQAATHSALPLVQDFESDTFNVETMPSDYSTVENGNFRLYTNDKGSWKVATDITGLTGNVAELKNVTSGKLTLAQRYFTKQTAGKVMVSFDAIVSSGTFFVYLANWEGLNYGSGSSATDINVLSFGDNNTFSAQSGAYSITGDGVWVANKPYHIDILFDIDNNKIYTTVDGNILTIDDVIGAKSEMTALQSVSFKTMGENSCVYLDNLEVQAFDDSAQVFAGDVEITNGALNVVGLDSLNVVSVGIDEATLENAKLYDLGTASVVKTRTEIALTPEAAEDGAAFSMASAFEAGKFYQLDLTNVKTFYGAPLIGEPVNFKASADIKIELNHDFVDKATASNPANGGALDTAITAIAPDGKDGIVSIDNVSDNDDIADGYALRLGDYDASTMDSDKNTGYRGQYGFSHSLKDEAFNIDATQGGKLTIDYEFINKTEASNDGRYDLYLCYGGSVKQIFRQNGGTAVIVSTEYPNAYYINANSAPNTVKLVFDFDNDELTVDFTANRMAEPISTTIDYNFKSSSGAIRDWDEIRILTGAHGTYGGYFDHFNVKYEKSALAVTDASFKDYRDNKVYAYEGGTIPASTKAMEIAFSTALSQEQIEAITVTDADGNAVGTGAYDEATNKYTVTFDNYLEPNSEYHITILGVTETVTTDEGDFALLERELTVDGSAVLTVKLINTTGEDKTFLMAVAAYTDGGLLLDEINVQEIVASDSQNKTVELALGTYDIVKGFVWSGIDTLRPLFPSAVYPAAE